MRLQKSSPGGVLAADRCGIQSVAAADVVDGRLTQRKAQIVRSPDNAIATPTRVFLEQFDDELFEFRIDRRSADEIGFGEGPLSGDQNPKPTQQGVGSDNCGNLPKAAPPDDLGFPSQAQALSVSETPGFAAELFEENPILLLLCEVGCYVELGIVGLAVARWRTFLLNITN